MELTIKIETNDVTLPGNLRQEIGLQFAVTDKDGRVWQDHVVARGKDTKAAVFSLAGQARLARSIAHMVGIVIENDALVEPVPRAPEVQPDCSALGCTWKELNELTRNELRELITTNGFTPDALKGNASKLTLLAVIEGVIEEID